MKNRELTILLVEDDSLDVEAFERAVGKKDIECDLMVAGNGADALEILRTGELSSVDAKYIIFLDINMPVIDGHEFMEELRGDNVLKTSIVFVLTSSEHERDRLLAYQKHVAGYFTKPNLETLLDMVKSYTLGVEFPPKIV